MIGSIRARRAGALVGCAVVVVGLTASAAQAQSSGSGARFAAEATSYQNTVIAQAMAHSSGGTRVSPDQVIWDSGAVILTVPTSADASAKISESSDNPGGCSDYYFCIWSGSGFSGASAAVLNAPAWDADHNYAIEDVWLPWGECSPDRFGGCDAGEHSWANESGYRTWLEQYQDSGNEQCITGVPVGDGPYSSNFTGPNALDYWVLMTTNAAKC
jgi:hypothetical protein